MNAREWKARKLEQRGVPVNFQGNPIPNSGEALPKNLYKTLANDLAFECERLEAALQEYGDHKVSCAITRWYITMTPKIMKANKEPDCTCGYTAALEGRS